MKDSNKFREEESLERGFQEALRRIKLAQARKSSILNLSGLQLNRIPESVKDLIGLTNISIGSNLISDLSPLEGLNNLTSAYLYGNQITDLSPLKGLTKLKLLFLSSNEISDLSPLAGLMNLTRLELGRNLLTDLSPLSYLSELEILSLSNNHIEDISPLSELKKLKILEISNSKVINLSPLIGLRELEALYINRTEVNDLSTLSGLPNLKKLDLSNTQVSDLSPLATLSGLTSLIANRARINDLSPLADLNRLRFIDLYSNAITDIKPLRTFLLEGIKISIDRPKKYHENAIYLFDNPLNDPPLEIAAQGATAVLQYWEETDASAEKLFEGRLLILGQGQVGKTSLLRKLQDPDKDLEDEGETHGINIWPDFRFPVPGETNEAFRASVWDFGGQDVQHESHQYFITPGTVFVLMINKRQTNKIDERQQLNYWLRIIAALGRAEGQKARVLVVNNVFADDNVAFGIDLSPFAELYEHELDLSLHRVDLMRKPEELASLRAELQTALLELPGVGQPSPAGWSVIRAELSERRARRRITFDEFAEVCAENGKEEEASQLLLCNYLKNLGEILYYDRRETSNDIVLDINWVTKAIYGITTTQEIIDRQGQFTEEEIIAIWRAKGIGRKTDHDLLLRLLKIDGFELCWNVAGTNRYLTPSLFTTQVPASQDLQANLGLKLQTTYLPERLLTQTIVRLHERVELEAYWRYGVYVRRGECRAALVRPLDEDALEIRVAGPSPDNYELQRLIYEEIETVRSRSFVRLRFQLLVPCACDYCGKDAVPHYFSREKLRELQGRGINEATCKNETKSSIGTLLKGLERTVAEPAQGGGDTYHITANQLTLNPHAETVNSTQTVEAPAEPEPFLHARHKRALVVVAVLSVLAGVAAYLFFPAAWADYVWVPLLVVIGLGSLWAFTRENKYFGAAMLVFGLSSSAIGLLQSLPTLEGYVRFNEESARGLMHFAIESSAALTVAILIGGYGLSAYLFWLSQREEPGEQ